LVLYEDLYRKSQRCLPEMHRRERGRRMMSSLMRSSLCVYGQTFN
jgi:hypothetical protein